MDPRSLAINKGYTMRLHNALVNLCKSSRLASKLKILKEIEVTTVRSYLEDKSTIASVVIADKDEEI